ncbi:hypothetical protein V6x_56750 [Gimesia chilikensis]|uniref:Uncharacterized protein n=1 Tax=Gimesia chilikensis TaxID=2605989 RepID=A0A517WL07_9PLAN|nr:hypothetical protein [Gimesia chilikensis]QDU05931.1 hypothetical protein V6x_56750 [Gimesia chilikensis]
MSEEIPTEYQEILHQIHSNVFLERLKDHLDPVDRRYLNEGDASDLNDLVRRLLVEEASPSIGSEVIQKLLGDDGIRDDLLKATSKIMKSQSKEA